MISALRLVASDIVSLPSLDAGAAQQAGKIEYAFWDNFSPIHLGKCYEPARSRHVDCAAQNGSVPSTQQDGLTSLEAGRVRPADGQRRDVVQRGLDGPECVGEVCLS